MKSVEFKELQGSPEMVDKINYLKHIADMGKASICRRFCLNRSQLDRILTTESVYLARFRERRENHE